MALADGATFGPYQIRGRLGRGGMATVYRAYEPGLDREIALKVLPEHLLEDHSALDRFRVEARAVARLVHPNILPVHAFGVEEASGTPWMALQLVEGGSLATLLGAGPLDRRRALALLRCLANALDHAHGQAILHRDVKPQNVLLGPHDHAYLADFGLARILSDSVVLSATGTVLGTPQYMAPEQALGEHVDARADVYALGVVAYEMLTGAPPFRADTAIGVFMKHAQEPVPIPPPSVAPEPLVRPLLRALAKNRDERWPSAGAFIDALATGIELAGPALAIGSGSAPAPRPPGTLVAPRHEPTVVAAEPARTLVAPPGPSAPVAPRPAIAPATTGSRPPLLLIGLALALLLAGAAGAGFVVLRGRSTGPRAGTSPGQIQAFADGAYAWIPPGSFFQGCTSGDADCEASESPRHRVTLSRGFWLGTTEVTVAQYRKLVPALPAAPAFNPGWQEAAQPIVNVTWGEAEAYCRSAGARLPTEAEWEFAARAGHDDRRFPWGAAATHEQANYGADGGFGGLAAGRDRWEAAAPVAQFPANDYGLHDVTGNVWEWTADWRGDYAAADVHDPGGPPGGDQRVIRGGSWANAAASMRLSSRDGHPPDDRHDALGLRCARDAGAR